MCSVVLTCLSQIVVLISLIDTGVLNNCVKESPFPNMVISCDRDLLL